jgi:hypothetical protein
VKQLDVETVIIGSRKIHADKLPIRAYSNIMFIYFKKTKSFTPSSVSKQQSSSLKQVPARPPVNINYHLQKKSLSTWWKLVTALLAKRWLFRCPDVWEPSALPKESQKNTARN